MVMPRLRERHDLPPSVVSSTPAVETATSTRSGSRGSTTTEWMPGAKSPSAAGVPNQCVTPEPFPSERSPPRDSWFQSAMQSAKLSPPSSLTKSPPGMVPT
ncbi:MAG: hypothetical protein M5U28_42745 [Sandaracinaceae bacterium]|nr:hypothetical protein [Sandaracinaceae bacterium]